MRKHHFDNKGKLPQHVVRKKAVQDELKKRRRKKPRH
jgi:hypothetical protein